MTPAPPWLDELALQPGPPWHPMGTRALAVDAWPLRDAEGEAQQAAKAVLLRDRREVVVASVASTAVDDAGAEVATVVTGRPGTLEDAALDVPDDLCLLIERDGHWRLDAGVVCFPSMWRLADKLGAPMAAVHGPVPGYAAELAERVDRFLDRLRPDRPVWRRNWLIHTSPELHQPEPPEPAVVDVPGGLWLRSELQTLRRLPSTGAILFTIRTQQVPLGVLASRPDRAPALAAAIASWSDELVAYRGASSWRAGVVGWLATLG